MSKRASSSVVLWIIASVFMVFIVVAILAPRPVDWSFSFSRNDDIPFGTSLVYKSLPSLFPGQHVTTAWSSEALPGAEDTLNQTTNIIFINHKLDFSSREVKNLLEAAEAGHHIFLAAAQLNGLPADTFKLTIQTSRMVEARNIVNSDSMGYNFANRHLKTVTGYWYPQRISGNYFSHYDSLKTTVLGHDHQGRTNFIKMQWGKGTIYFNCNPLAFTNYHLLSRNHSEYIFKALSYLPEAPVIWDEYYKSRNARTPGLFNYVLEKPSLKAAWYVVVFLVLVYSIFESGRRQRAIPEIRKPENTTVNFVQSVARLYLSRQDHLDIARKRFTYFLEFLRSRYYIDTSGENAGIISETALKSGIRERSVAAIFKVAGNLNRVNRITAEDLEQFNRQIEFFYNNCE